MSIASIEIWTPEKEESESFMMNATASDLDKLKNIASIIRGENDV